MTKNQKELLAHLGKGYHMETVDFEDCICRTIGDRSIEISGTATRHRPYNVYVWEVLAPGKYGQIVEKYFDIKTDAELYARLNEIESRLTGSLPQ